MTKIVFLDAYTLASEDLDISVLNALGEYVQYDRTPKNLIEERIKDAEIIISNKAIIDKGIIDNCPHLKFIQVAATGYNNVDTAYAKSKGIVVSNVSGYSTDSVVQLVMATIFNHYYNLPRYYSDARANVWSQSKDFSYWHQTIPEFSSLTLGVVGFGNIGRALAKRAHNVGFKILAYNKYPERAPLAYVKNQGLEGVLSNSDIISLHLPLNASTNKIINKADSKLFKPNSILFNTGRGGLVDEQALDFGLNNGQLSAAYLDVLNQEPPEQNHFLFSNPNCFITPHIAWASLQARQTLLEGIVNNIKAYKLGAPKNVVN